MSCELEAFREASAGWTGSWELVLKRSVGAGLTRRASEPALLESWSEEAHAVRVAGPDGRSALASAPSWAGLEATAGAARADARRQAVPAVAAEPFAGPPPEGLANAVAPCEPPRPEELEAWLDALLDGARSVEERTGALELGRARRARVSTRLVNSRGLDVTVVQDLAQLEAEAIGREIAKHAGVLDGVVASRLDAVGARALGERMGRAVRRQLDGVPRAPAGGAVLLAPEVVAEITFRLAPALLGLRPCEAPTTVLGGGLRLREDAAEDEAARSLPLDGVGRPLTVVELTPGGRFRPPERGLLPLVRPGVADPPRPGWLRLSWSADDGLADEELVARLGTGLLLERAVTSGFDPGRLTWAGHVEGWWVENGAGKRPVARLPVEWSLPELAASVRAAGAEPRSAHASGTCRAVSWLLDALPGAAGA